MSTTLRIRDALMAGPLTRQELGAAIGMADLDALSVRLGCLRRSGLVVLEPARWHVADGAESRQWTHGRAARGSVRDALLAELQRGPLTAMQLVRRTRHVKKSVRSVLSRLKAEGRVVRRNHQWALPEHAKRIKSAVPDSVERIKQAMRDMQPGSADYCRAQRTLANLRAQA